jgi:hypothetical protein
MFLGKILPGRRSCGLCPEARCASISASVLQVYNASGATEQQRAELRPIIRQKRDNLLLKHRGDEVQAVEAQ